MTAAELASSGAYDATWIVISLILPWVFVLIFVLLDWIYISNRP